jgi:YcxB-like protein
VAIQLSIVYSLREYLVIVREKTSQMVRDDFARKGKPFRSIDKMLMSMGISLVAPPVFFLKKRKMPVCEFVIDESGISRAAGGATYRTPWAKVKNVNRLKTAYLVELESGAMPLPYRCFPDGDRAAFEGILRDANLSAPT